MVVLATLSRAQNRFSHRNNLIHSLLTDVFAEYYFLSGDFGMGRSETALLKGRGFLIFTTSCLTLPHLTAEHMRLLTHIQEVLFLSTGVVGQPLI